MRQARSLWAIVAVSLVAISLFPVYTIGVLAPRFEELLLENTKEEATRLARYLSTFVIEEGEKPGSTALAPRLADRLASLERDEHLVKMRVFSPSGEILYSTDPAEVGQVNREGYFRRIVESGTQRAEIIPRHARSLENEVFSADVVEIYVPIMKRGRLLGVFELYHDISKERTDLNRLVYRSYGTLFVMSVGLLALVLVSSFQAHRSMKERARAEEQLRQLSLTDELTGLYNRRGFLALGGQQMRIASRGKNPMMVVSADLDGLKAINDGFGHKEGDAAIAETARILKESFRDADLVARIGGDEFAVLLTGGEAAFDGEQLDTRLQEIVEKHNQRDDRPYRISVGAGFARFDPGEAQAFEECLYRADAMMYAQKRRKRGLAQ